MEHFTNFTGLRRPLSLQCRKLTSSSSHCSSQADELDISVSDSGIGIHFDRFEQIFQAFEQVMGPSGGGWVSL